MGSRVASAMFFPPTVTPRIVGFSRAPPHLGQATCRMYCS